MTFLLLGSSQSSPLPGGPVLPPAGLCSECPSSTSIPYFQASLIRQGLVQCHQYQEILPDVPAGRNHILL